MKNSNLPDAFTALIIGLTLALLCVVVSLLVTGCSSPPEARPTDLDHWDFPGEVIE